MTSSGENKKKTSKAEAVTAEATRRKEEVELRKEGTHGRGHVQILGQDSWLTVVQVQRQKLVRI